MKIILSLLITIFLLSIDAADFNSDVRDVLEQLYSSDYDSALILADSVIEKYDSHAGEYLKIGIFSTYMSDFEIDTLEDSLRKYFETITMSEHKNAYDYFFTGGAYLHYAYLFIWRNDYANALRYGLHAKHMFDISNDNDNSLYDAYLGKGIVEYMISQFKARIPFVRSSSNGLDKIEIAADSSLFASVAAYDVLSMIYSTEGRYDEADSIIRILRERYPQNRMFMFSAYKNAIAAKDSAGALSILEELSRNIIDNQPENLYNLAFCFSSMAALYSHYSDTSRALMSAYAVKDIINSGIEYNYKRLRDFDRLSGTIIKQYER